MARKRAGSTGTFVSRADLSAEPMPDLVEPMLAKHGDLPRDDAAHGYEIKWDGVRAIAHVDAGDLTLSGRNGTDFSGRYPEIDALAEDQASRRMVLDGEVVAFDPDGRPSFERLQSRMHLGSDPAVRRRMGDIPVTYVIFDLLWLEGHSTIPLAYADRRKLLAELELTGPAWRTPAYREGDGASLKRASEAQDLEGIVAKRLDSSYEPGRRSAAWIKIKNQCVQEFVVGGFTPGSGGRSMTLGALALGVYERSGGDAGLLYTGKVGTGFTEATMGVLVRELQALRSPENPFQGRRPPKETFFVEPRLVARVEFREWTRTGTLRAPSFKGLVPDAEPASVVRDT
jgi:bifunctional non-homologous end joining protein LigD